MVTKRSLLFWRQQHGFTLVEVAVIVPMALLVLGTVFTYMVLLYNESLQATAKLGIIDEATTAVNRINEAGGTSAGFQSALSSYLTDVNAPSGWNAEPSPGTSDVLILRSIATTANTKSAAKKIVRLNKVSGGCTANNEPINPILYYNTVFFLKKESGQDTGTLYRRTIAKNTDDSGLAACDTPVQQKQTCPVGQTNTACSGTDAVVATDVKQFKVTYAVGGLNCGTAVDTYNDRLCVAGSLAAATNAYIELTLSRTTAGEPYEYRATTVIEAVNRR